MFALVDKESYRIIEFLEAPEIVENKWVKTNEGSLIQLIYVDIVEVQAIKIDFKYYKDGKFYNDVPEIVESKKSKLLEQLKQLDLIVPRIVEDLIEQGSFNIHQSKLDIIEKKKEIRIKLQGLGGS